MHIFAFGDTHEQSDFMYLASRCKDADIICCIGDISEFRRGLENSLLGLEKLGNHVQKYILLIHGNHDGIISNDLLIDKKHILYLNQSAFETDVLRLSDTAGGGFAKYEPQFEQFIHDIHLADDKPTIWLMHGPPHDTEVDVIDGWGPTGSISRRSMIEQYQPSLLLLVTSTKVLVEKELLEIHTSSIQDRMECPTI